MQQCNQQAPNGAFHGPEAPNGPLSTLDPALIAMGNIDIARRVLADPRLSSTLRLHWEGVRRAAEVDFLRVCGG